jgi:hypothetical protein
MTNEELNAKLAAHKRWLAGDKNGIGVNLYGVNAVGWCRVGREGTNAGVLQ